MIVSDKRWGLTNGPHGMPLLLSYVLENQSYTARFILGALYIYFLERDHI